MHVVACYARVGCTYVNWMNARGCLLWESGVYVCQQKSVTCVELSDPEYLSNLCWIVRSRMLVIDVFVYTRQIRKSVDYSPTVSRVGRSGSESTSMFTKTQTQAPFQRASVTWQEITTDKGNVTRLVSFTAMGIAITSLPHESSRWEKWAQTS